MKLFDVNVLIYAHRIDQVHHDFYREFIEDLVNGVESFGLSPLTAVGFVRIVTNPKFPNGPTPLVQALAVVDSFSTLSHCIWTPPAKRHWELTRDLCRQSSCSGKGVADAQHAAIAIEHACEWVTRDRDFEKFVAHGLKLTLLEP
jgi:toxin-antitoxin system PIN domain toxin